MAADTRPYKSKEQDGQGNEVIIRDQQLVEQSTVTTMPSGACFETLDIDGRPVKIPRDNMMSIVLECIGIVLNDSSKNLGTNVNKALGLQGNTIGNVTVNDFASVLGDQFKIKRLDFDGQSATITGNYFGFFIARSSKNWSATACFWGAHNGNPQTIKSGAIDASTNTDEDSIIFTGPTGTTKVNVLYIGL